MIELICGSLMAKKISGEEPMEKKLIQDRIHLLDKSLFLGSITDVSDRIRSLTYNTEYIDKRYENFRIECIEDGYVDSHVYDYYLVADRLETDKEYDYRLKIEEKKRIKEEKQAEKKKLNKIKTEEFERKEYERLKKKYEKDTELGILRSNRLDWL